MSKDIPKWDWIPCELQLKTDTSNFSGESFNLQPSVILTSPSPTGDDPEVKLYIDTEKQLQYSKELGWNWHKSWNLPNISVRLEVKESSTQQSLLPPKNLYAQIFAVKAVSSSTEQLYLVDVGIRGSGRLELVNGQAFFQAIKFFSTSYNNEGVKFHLVLCLYLMHNSSATGTNTTEQGVPKVLTAIISPPIFVDSRKSARDSNIVFTRKMNSFIEPFSPDTFLKSFIKRENKKKSEQEAKINNDSYGLFNYLTAPNIRHKVKHPLFLAIKFSTSVKLLFNARLIQQLYPTFKVEDILGSLQRQLVADHAFTRSHNSTNAETSGKLLGGKMFLMYIDETRDIIMRRKILEAIEPLACQSLGITSSPAGEGYINLVEVFGMQEIIKRYEECYPTLTSMMVNSTNIGLMKGENFLHQGFFDKNRRVQQEDESQISDSEIQDDHPTDGEEDEEEEDEISSESNIQQSSPHKDEDKVDGAVFSNGKQQFLLKVSVPVNEKRKIFDNTDDNSNLDEAPRKQFKRNSQSEGMNQTTPPPGPSTQTTEFQTKLEEENSCEPQMIVNSGFSFVKAISVPQTALIRPITKLSNDQSQNSQLTCNSSFQKTPILLVPQIHRQACQVPFHALSSLLPSQIHSTTMSVPPQPLSSTSIQISSEVSNGTSLQARQL